MYCYPTSNQLVITGHNCQDFYLLKSGLSIDSFDLETQQRFRYEIDLGKLFPQCRAHINKPLIVVHFDYMIRYPDPEEGLLKEFPVGTKDYHKCHRGEELEVMNNGNFPQYSKFVEHHRQHMGGIHQFQVVNKLNFLSRHYKIVLVEWGDLLLWEEYQPHLYHFHPWAKCRRAKVWKSRKRQVVAGKHPVRDAVDPVQHYLNYLENEHEPILTQCGPVSSHLEWNTGPTKFYGPVEEKQYLDVAQDCEANGCDGWPQQMDVSSLCDSDVEFCECYFTSLRTCRHCAVSHGRSNTGCSEEQVMGWLKGIAAELIGDAVTGSLKSTWKWAGNSAFSSDEKTSDNSDLLDTDLLGYGMSLSIGPWTKLGDTPGLIDPDDDMSLPVGPWTYAPETVKGHCAPQGHLLVDWEGHGELRYFPLTGEYIIRAKYITKVKHFAAPGKVFDCNHPSWKEFNREQRAYPWKLDNMMNLASVKVHTTKWVEKFILDFNA